MDEGDEPAVGADARMLVDKLQSGRFESTQFMLNVAHFQGHVVHALAMRLQKSGDASPFGDRHQQFKITGPSRKRGNTYSLIVEICLNWLTEPNQTIMLDRFREITYDDTDMMKLEPPER